MGKLSDRFALITGAGAGIGRATAMLFAKKGAKVAVADMVAEDGIETVKMIREAGGEAIFVEADVSKAADARKMVETAVGKYGRFDILFDNAGILRFASAAEMTEEPWDMILDVNLKVVFLGSKYAIPQMIKQRNGVIINTASECGHSGFPTHSAYGILS